MTALLAMGGVLFVLGIGAGYFYGRLDVPVAIVSGYILGCFTGFPWGYIDNPYRERRDHP